MSAGAYLYIRTGDNYSFTTNVAQGGVGTNMVNANIWFQAWGDPFSNYNDYVELINVSTATGEIAVSGANNNVVTINLNGNATANYQIANVAKWALRAQLSTGGVYTLDHGLCAITNSLIVEPWT